MKQKAFFTIFKGVSMKQISPNFLEGERPTLKELRNHILCYNRA